MLHTAATFQPRLFRILIGPRGTPRLEFAVYAASSADAFQQNVCLREPGERMEVLPVGDAA